MMPLAPSRRCWLVVILFAVAMAWVEAASVYYIRVVVDRIVPYQQNPLPVGGVLGAVELVREASTLIMLLTVGILAGRAWHERLGYSALAFGVWDILYYVFLRVMSGWPTSLLDWDVLFLLPLPWWGPVLAPVSIALLMVVWGTLVTQSGDRSCRVVFPVRAVGPRRARHRARALRVHVRRDSIAAARTRGDEAGAAHGIQLATVRAGARPHGRARRRAGLARTVQPWSPCAACGSPSRRIQSGRLVLSGGLRPPNPPARSLAGARRPAPLAWLARCRSLALFIYAGSLLAVADLHPPALSPS